MPRLFTALEVPAELAESLSTVRGGLTGARWIDAENYHITLRFIGDVGVRAANEIAEMLSQINRESLTLSMNGLDIFGGNKPRALIAKVQPNEALSELRNEQERICRKLGLMPESRKFTPHVTLARLRQTKAADAATFLASRGGLFAPPFNVGRFVLMSAKESLGGGPYVVEAAYALRRQELSGNSV